MRTPPGIRWLGWISAGFALLLLAPVAIVFLQSLRGDSGAFSGEHYARVLSTGRQWRILATSTGIAVATALITALMGLAVGASISALHGWLRRAAWVLTVLPFAVPPYARAAAWTDALGPSGLPIPLAPGYGAAHMASVVLILSLAWYPIPAIAAALALPRVSRAGRDAARLVYGNPRVFWTVTLPQLLPALGTATCCVAIMALASFEIPALLQVNTYPVEIYTEFMLSYDARSGAAQAVPLLAIGIAILAVWRVVVVRPWATYIETTSVRSPEAGQQNYMYLLAPLVFGALAALLPLGYLVARSLPAANYREAWLTAREAIVTSLSLATIIATAGVMAAIGCAWAQRYWSRSARSYVFLIAGFLVSGPVAGIGLITFWNRPGFPGIVYDSMAIILLAVLLRYFFFVAQGMYAAFAMVPRRYDEAALGNGMPLRRVFAHVTLPLAAPMIAGIWCLVFIFAFNEIDATVLVVPPGVSTLPIRLYGLFHYGPSPLVSALAVIACAISTVFLGLALLAFRYAGRRLHARG